MATHDVGDLVTIWAVFRDAYGAQANPTTIALTVQAPGAEAADVSAVQAIEAELPIAETATGETLTDETGVYKGEVEVDTSGLWRYRWEGTGAVTEAGEGSFLVRRQRVPA
jgi:hypothetical protein